MRSDLLARIDAFRPSPGNDNWRELDDLVQSLDDLELAAVPALLRVFERFPRHDGHGVFWSILHVVERIAGYEPLLVEHVARTPTEMGITMLRRLVSAGISRVDTTELAPLIATLAPRAPVVDYTIEPIAPRVPISPLPLEPLLEELAAFAPAQSWDVDWSPLLALVPKLIGTCDPAIVTPLLQTLDRFHAYDGFSPFWPIVNGLEQLPSFPSALVASMQRAPTKSGVTLLLRLLARDITTVDGVDLAALAAARIGR